MQARHRTHLATGLINTKEHREANPVQYAKLPPQLLEPSTALVSEKSTPKAIREGALGVTSTRAPRAFD